MMTQTTSTLRVDTSAPAANSAPRARTSSQQIRRLKIAGQVAVFGIVVPLGLWMTLAPLAMAVVASAHVKVDQNRRPVQHLEGGIVREVLVRDGQIVKQGDPVLVIGDVGVDADRNRLSYRLAIERAAAERSDAEQRRAATLVFSRAVMAEARLDPRVKEALDKEVASFTARQVSLESELALLKQQRERIRQEIGGLQAQIDKAQESLTIQRTDLESTGGLAKDGFVSNARVHQMEATIADYTVKLEERRTELARGGGRLLDNDMKSNAIVNDYVRSASDQLKQTMSRVSEIEQELRKSTDATKRQVVLAPAAGAVIDLKFTSPGAVVRPGDSIAEIVPADTALMIEAQIKPEDVNYVQTGQAARIKFTSFKYRNNTMVTGKVMYVSADRFTDKVTQMPYYSVSILADADSIAAVGDLKMQAGMPAEVYIEGGTQTALQYLAQPVTAAWQKAARQM